MFVSFFSNACILIAVLSIVQQILKDKDLSIDISIKVKVLVGLGCGILGLILLENSVHVTDNVIVDFRNIAIMQAALFGGPIASVIAGIVIGLFRLLFMGITQSSMVAFITALINGVGFGIIASLKISKNKIYFWMTLQYFVIVSIALSILINDVELLLRTLFMVYIGGTLIIFLTNRFYSSMIKNINLHQKLKKDSTKDFLTGLNNVRQFNTSIFNLSQMTIRNNGQLSLLMMDIDFFKAINDTYGHNAGDLVLKELSKTLLDSFRSYDVISRNGGEEFSIILIDCPASYSLKIAERLRNEIEQKKFSVSETESTTITLSIGVSTYPECIDNIDSLIETADNALYKAKKTGRNKVILFSDEKIG